MSCRRPDIVLYRGLSMWPCFQEGDLLEVMALPSESIRIGDCVLLRDAGGRQIVHRVVALRGGVRTRGDAMGEADDHDEVAPQLLGRVVGRYRLGKRSPVAGGRAGALAGRFYRYVGRIDPERPGRGGWLARWMRRLSRPLTRIMLRRGELVQLALPGGEEITIWRWWGTSLARRQGVAGNWQVYWPWRIVFTLPDD